MKSIFITGAAKGIGLQTALRFASEGWLVGASDVDAQGLAALEQSLSGKPCFTAVMDVTDAQAVAATLEKFAERTGGTLDVFVNNAGVAFLDAFEEIPLAKHHAVIGVNVTGVLNCAHQAFPNLKRTPGSVLVNMSSAAAHYGVAWEVSYSASKFFVRGLTEALNLEWERHGIHVCDVMPNFVDTPMMKPLRSKVVENVGIHLKADDVVNVIWKAVHGRRVHWLVESGASIFFQKVAAFLPNAWVRGIMKKTAGL